MYIHTYMNTNIHMYIPICTNRWNIHIPIYAHIHICRYTHAQTSINTYMHSPIYTNITHTPIHLHMYMHIYTHISTYMYISTYMHTHIYKQMNTHIHTCTQCCNHWKLDFENNVWKPLWLRRKGQLLQETCTYYSTQEVVSQRRMSSSCLHIF